MSSKRRPRASIACTECRRKKIRCDTGQPKCRNCINTQSDCIYHSVRKPASNGQKRQKLDVGTRLARIERMLERVLEEQHPEVEYEYEDDFEEEEELDPVNATEVVSSTFHATPLDDPIQSHGLGSVVLSRRYMDKLGGWVGNADLIGALQTSLVDFAAHVSQRTIDKIAMLNLESSDLMVDPELVQRVRNYLATNPTHGMNVFLTLEEFDRLAGTDLVTSGPYCGPGILFYSVVSTGLAQNIPVLELLLTGGEHSSLEIQHACVAYSNALHASLNSAVFRPNLAILRGILALLNSPLTVALPAAAEIFFSRRCVEICSDLGLNRKSFYAKLSPAEARRQKLLFWYAYCANRSSSLRIGCSPTMTTSQISTDLPDFEPQNSDLCHIRHQVELFKLYDLIYERLCSVYAERRPLRQLIRDIMACDQKLEEWWNSLDPWMRDAPNFDLDPLDHTSIASAKRHKLINMISSYHYLTICVHRMTALVPSSVQKQLRSMFPQAYQQATNTQFSPSDSTDTANTPHSESGFEDFTPHELQHRILRLINSMELCADAGRKLLRLDSCTLDHNALGIVTTGRIYDLLNTASALLLKSVLCTDSKCREDAILLRKASSMFAEMKTSSDLSIKACTLLDNSAQVIEYMCDKNLGQHQQAPHQPTQHQQHHLHHQQPQQQPKPEPQELQFENTFTSWPDLEAQQGGFEGLVGELFPEFGLTHDSLFMPQ